MTTRRFTLDEANALIPRLEMEFGRLSVCQGKADEAARDLGGMDRALGILKGQMPPSGKDEAAKQLLAATSEVLATLERINGLGCLIKDLEFGIVDFPGEHAGNEVNLCWQYGEPEVLHFHGAEEADSKRQRLFESAQQLLRVH